MSSNCLSHRRLISNSAKTPKDVEERLVGRRASVHRMFGGPQRDPFGLQYPWVRTLSIGHLARPTTFAAILTGAAGLGGAAHAAPGSAKLSGHPSFGTELANQEAGYV